MGLEEEGRPYDDAALHSERSLTAAKGMERDDVLLCTVFTDTWIILEQFLQIDSTRIYKN